MSDQPQFRIRNKVQIDGKDATINSQTIDQILQDSDGNLVICRGVEVPTDAGSGYAKGCIFLQTDGGVGTTLYVNEGSSTSCDFNLGAGEGAGATTFAGLSDTPSNYSGAGDKVLKVNAGATAVEFVDVSGDVDMDASGVFSISSDVIVNDDVNTSAGIAFSKLEALSSARLVVGSAGNVPTAVDITGDLSLANDGSTTVTDLTITDEAQGSILYFDGSNWVRLVAGTSGHYLKTQGAGADPIWSTVNIGTADSIAQSATLEDGGANDAILAFTEQTVSAPTLTIPDFAGVSDTFVFTTLAQTLVNKTLTSPVLTTPQINDTSADHQYVFAVNELVADRNVTLPLLGSDDTFVFEAHAQTLSNKVLTAPQINDTSADHQYIFAVNELVADRSIELPLLGADDVFVFEAHTQTLTNKTLTSPRIASLTPDAVETITMPVATDTLVGKATTDELTNKTIDADGTGNVISNINGDELDPSAGTSGAYGVPIIVPVANSGSADVNVFSGNVPFKLRVLDAWAVNTQAGNAGNWKLTDGTDDITATVAYGATDQSITRADKIDDAQHVMTGEALHLINSNAADTSIVYVMVMRVD